MPQFVFLKLLDNFRHGFDVPQFPIPKIEVTLLPYLSRILGK